MAFVHRRPILAATLAIFATAALLLAGNGMNPFPNAVPRRTRRVLRDPEDRNAVGQTLRSHDSLPGRWEVANCTVAPPPT